MATLYSDDFTKVRAGREAQANVYRGKVRMLAWFFASLPVGNIGDVLVCGILPGRARVIQGREFHSAHGGAATGAYSTFAIAPDGITVGAIITAGKYLAAITFVAAGQNELANTVALSALVEESADVMLCCMNAGSAFATAGTISGYLLHTID